MAFSQPVTNLIHQRYSCRNYRITPIPETAYHELVDFIATLPAGPFNAPNRFQLAAATEQDSSALRGLGTYGNVKNPSGFIIGATKSAKMDMEDFGLRMETIVLKATDLGLATCWLGGFFTRSSFSKKIGGVKGETLPAICSVGVPVVEKNVALVDQSRSRLGWDELFFTDNFTSILKPDQAGAYGVPLEMVRLAPSARNLQPCRIIKQANKWHFYLQRSKGYREMVLPDLTGIADLQRIDMGIAMAHFELAAIEAGLTGQWQVNDPGLLKPNRLNEYSVSWIPS
ncbi:MAG TPA: nitroreductase family protein [Leptolinea sp.]